MHRAQLCSNFSRACETSFSISSEFQDISGQLPGLWFPRQVNMQTNEPSDNKADTMFYSSHRRTSHLTHGLFCHPCHFAPL